MKAIAKKKGIPQEQAQLLLEAVKGDDTYKDVTEDLAKLIDAGQLVQQLPEQMQPLTMPLLMQAMGSSRSRSREVAENAAMIVAALKALDTNDSATQLIEELRKEIQELKEEKQKKEIKEELESAMGTVVQYVQKLEERIASVETQNATRGRQEEEDELDRLEKYLEKVEQTRERLKRLGLIQEGSANEPDPEKAAEILQKMGYKVEPPPSYEQMKRLLDEELKKREKEIRKQVEQEMGFQEKKMTMAVDLITAIIDGIVSASTTPQTGGSEIAKFTQLVRQSLGGVGNGGGNSGPDEVNSGGEGAN